MFFLYSASKIMLTQSTNMIIIVTPDKVLFLSGVVATKNDENWS